MTYTIAGTNLSIVAEEAAEITRVHPRAEVAIQFATMSHGAQTYGTGDSRVPYMVHTIGVAHLVLRCGGTEAEVIAAILHDVVEDTPVKLVAIRRIFGHEAAGLVWEVTKEEGVDHLTKIGDAALVKLCDSVYNISRIGGLKPARKERLVVKYTRNFQVLLTRPRLVGLALPGDVQEVVSRDSADFLA